MPEMFFLVINCLISIFSSPFYMQLIILRIINAQSNINGEKTRKLDSLAKLFQEMRYVDKTVTQLTKVRTQKI